MMNRVAVVTLVAMISAGSAVDSTRDPEALVVHEWGTFTSIAGATGDAVPWVPLLGSDDLPCFVERFRRYRGKGFLRGTVRMETPVVYFYAPRETTVDVSVRFPGGLITEWFPRAEVTPAEPVPDDGLARRGFGGSAKWTGVRVLPRSREDFPTQGRSSHYYLARQTDAAPVEVAGAREKFLFYRGVADIRLPIAAIPAADGSVRVAQQSQRAARHRHPVRAPRRPHRFRDSHVRRRQRHLSAAAVDEGCRSADGSPGNDFSSAVGSMRGRRRRWSTRGATRGSKRGRACSTSCRTRQVDAMLPLEIKPRPSSMARVFVGRMEVITPATRTAVERALIAQGCRQPSALWPVRGADFRADLRRSGGPPRSRRCDPIDLRAARRRDTSSELSVNAERRARERAQCISRYATAIMAATAAIANHVVPATLLSIGAPFYMRRLLCTSHGWNKTLFTGGRRGVAIRRADLASSAAPVSDRSHARRSRVASSLSSCPAL